MSWLSNHREFILSKIREGISDSGERFAHLYLQFYEGVLKGSIKVPRYFSPEEMSLIKSVWRTVKRQAEESGKPLYLLGRDVWVFEVLARREHYPTCFNPQVSRATCHNFDFSDCFIFDTGFIGTIPNRTGCTTYSLLSSDRNPNKWQRKSLRPKDLGSRQTLGYFNSARGLALKIEATPKYWRSAILGLGYKPQQGFADPKEMVQALLLTEEVFRDSSPRFVSKTPVLPDNHYWPNPVANKMEDWCWNQRSVTLLSVPTTASGSSNLSIYVSSAYSSTDDALYLAT